ncbi:hypothetical protein [Paenibacillus hemerocallicola]|nr:hypothetical protein [Paenibacillus hemerocallicola]
MKQYYVFDFPLEMYGIGLVFAVLLLLIVYSAYRRTKVAGQAAGKRK